MRDEGDRRQPPAEPRAAPPPSAPPRTTAPSQVPRAVAGLGHREEHPGRERRQVRGQHPHPGLGVLLGREHERPRPVGEQRDARDDPRVEPAPAGEEHEPRRPAGSAA